MELGSTLPVDRPRLGLTADVALTPAVLVTPLRCVPQRGPLCSRKDSISTHGVDATRLDRLRYVCHSHCYSYTSPSPTSTLNSVLTAHTRYKSGPASQSTYSPALHGLRGTTCWPSDRLAARLAACASCVAAVTSHSPHWIGQAHWREVAPLVITLPFTRLRLVGSTVFSLLSQPVSPCLIPQLAHISLARVCYDCPDGGARLRHAHRVGYSVEPALPAVTRRTVVPTTRGAARCLLPAPRSGQRPLRAERPARRDLLALPTSS
jgi:hypothetical protein